GWGRGGSRGGAGAGGGGGAGGRVGCGGGRGQRLPVAGGGGLEVRGVLVHQAEMVERVGLARLVAEIRIQRRGLGKSGGGRRVFPGQLLQQAEFVERPGLAGTVPGALRRVYRRLVLGCCLVPVAARTQEAAHGRGDGDGVQGQRLGGVANRRVQVRPLGLPPCGR